MDEAAGEIQKIVKPDREWREELSEEEYQVTRAQGTEEPFRGRYWETKTRGTYSCVCCGLPLFSSETKFDSGTGWPSFFEPVQERHVETRPDTSLGRERTEVICRRCDAHLGHVFRDGPEPTGLRYCINSVALRLEE